MCVKRMPVCATTNKNEKCTYKQMQLPNIFTFRDFMNINFPQKIYKHFLETFTNK